MSIEEKLCLTSVDGKLLDKAFLDFKIVQGHQCWYSKKLVSNA